MQWADCLVNKSEVVVVLAVGRLGEGRRLLEGWGKGGGGGRRWGYYYVYVIIYYIYKIAT